MHSLLSVLSRHFPGAIACAASALAAALWLVQDPGGTTQLSFGMVVIIVCLGLGLGGLAAEATALAAWTVPGEAPIGSIIIALIFALPFYGVAILLSSGAMD